MASGSPQPTPMDRQSLLSRLRGHSTPSAFETSSTSLDSKTGTSASSNRSPSARAKESSSGRSLQRLEPPELVRQQWLQRDNQHRPQSDQLRHLWESTHQGQRAQPAAFAPVVFLGIRRISWESGGALSPEKRPQTRATVVIGAPLPRAPGQ